MSESQSQSNVTLNVTPDIYAAVLNDMGNYVDTNNLLFPVKCPCTNKEFVTKSSFNLHKCRTKKHKEWLSELNTNKTNFYKDTVNLNKLVKQQQEMITTRDNIIETQKLHILHIEKQLQQNIHSVDLLDIDN